MARFHKYSWVEKIELLSDYCKLISRRGVKEGREGRGGRGLRCGISVDALDFTRRSFHPFSFKAARQADIKLKQ